MNSAEIVTRFNDRINARDLDGLAALMTDDHTFTDTAENRIAGKDACVEAWRGFFATFPDYRNVFEQIVDSGEHVAVRGHSVCADARLNGRALWSAVVRDRQVSAWRVWADTPASRATLGLA